MADDLEALAESTARIAEERRREAEAAVSRLVAFIGSLEATLAKARESLVGIASLANATTPAAPAARPEPPPAEQPKASVPRPRPTAPPAGPVFPNALWLRVQAIESAGQGELLAPEVEALGMTPTDGGNQDLVNELLVRGWSLHPSADGMIYSRVAAEQTLANRKAAIEARQAAGRG